MLYILLYILSLSIYIQSYKLLKNNSRLHNKVKQASIGTKSCDNDSWPCQAEFDTYIQPNIHPLERVESHSHTHDTSHILRFCHGKTMPNHFRSKSWTRQILHVSPYNTPNSLGSKWKSTVTNILLKRSDNIT